LIRGLFFERRQHIVRLPSAPRQPLARTCCVRAFRMAAHRLRAASPLLHRARRITLESRPVRFADAG
jgi:hypothetical protein